MSALPCITYSRPVRVAVRAPICTSHAFRDEVDEQVGVLEPSSDEQQRLQKQ